MAKKSKKKKKLKKQATADTIDRHMLYEASVQDPDFDIEICERVYKTVRGKKFHRLREDFCGTALLASEWAAKDKKNQVWGVDLHKPTLDWGRQHHLAHLNSAAKRVHLLQANVLEADAPPVDVVLATNFSCYVFKTRDLLREYFKSAYEGLAKDGLFILDAFGGTEAMGHKKDRRKVDKTVRRDGLKVPKFTYVWDQARFNTINHDITCHIHFRFADGSKINKAFTYHWRLWTLPEIQELLLEAGFKSTEVYLHGWHDDGESDEIYRRRKYFENTLGWVGYVVGIK